MRRLLLLLVAVLALPVLGYFLWPRTTDPALYDERGLPAGRAKE